MGNNNSKGNNPTLSEYDERKEKLKKLEDLNIKPYPAKAERSHLVSEVLEKFDNFEKEKAELNLCGRLRSKRVHGNLSFVDLEDSSGKIQVAISKKEVGEKYKPFAKLIDNSDFVQFTGKVFITEAGQKTLMASDWKLLTKSLRSVPTEHFGLKDEDDRYRKRYLDLLLNVEKRELFMRRAKFWRAIRTFMIDKGFMEVETPTLETTTGGAEARPFKTYHNDFNLPVYMRICIGELWQKRLMAAGLEKTFEVGRAYRNEGSSPDHLQEFTNMEFYWAYADYNDGMKLVQEMYRFIAKEVYGKTNFEARGHKFDLADDWAEIDYVDEIKRQTGVDVITATKEELEKKLAELDVKYDGENRERLMDSLWKYCRANIAGPAFLINHPVTVSPLAKVKEGKSGQTERFQPILGGAEVGNGYSELNNPIDQQERFEEQKKLLDAGDEEAMMPDWEFVEMLEYGMPPTCGFGVGERLFAFFENQTLREATLFPLMKPKDHDEEGQGEGHSTQSVDKKDVEEEITGDLGIDLEKANELVGKYITDPVTKLHSQESAAIMRGLAKHFGKDDETVEKWGIIGLLHDLDWDETKDNPAEHSIKSAKYLKEAGATDFLIEAIKSHNYGYEHNEELKNKKRGTKLQHSLAAAETLTGLIVASSLILPTKTVKDVKLKSLKKRFKASKFAANCNRDIISESEKIGIKVDDFLEIGLTSLQEVADELEI